MMPHSHLGWNPQQWVPIAGQIGLQGIPNFAPFIAQQALNPNHPGLAPMLNANHLQQWNFQPR